MNMEDCPEHKNTPNPPYPFVCECPTPEPLSFHWIGSCTCMGEDRDCSNDNDNWAAICPDCGRDCYYDSVPPYNSGAIAWYCSDAGCGWWE